MPERRGASAARTFGGEHLREDVGVRGARKVVALHIVHPERLLRRHVRQPLVANQVEISLLHLPLIDEGVVANTTGHA